MIQFSIKRELYEVFFDEVVSYRITFISGWHQSISDRKSSRSFGGTGSPCSVEY